MNKRLLFVALVILSAAGLTGCAASGSSASGSTAPKIGGYIDTSIEHQSK